MHNKNFSVPYYYQLRERERARRTAEGGEAAGKRETAKQREHRGEKWMREGEMDGKRKEKPRK